MIGEYLRVTDAELARAIKEPEWALDLIDEVVDAQEEAAPPPGRARHLTTYQAWHLIAFLLHRADFPVDVVYGERDLTEEDWGYGPAKYLDAAQVATAAAALAPLTYDALVEGLDPAELTAAEIYPMTWDDPDPFAWGRTWFEPLPPFFAAAAAAGDSMLVWLA
ncbi:DUF1877 family protein [Actinocorallia longicatena]|uniref:YfbM family protein n=1 Tax=Actinocorallia longicatena TaxID=111803 RepID=A0ABP6QBV9_9ACTN